MLSFPQSKESGNSRRWIVRIAMAVLLLLGTLLYIFWDSLPVGDEMGAVPIPPRSVAATAQAPVPPVPTASAVSIPAAPLPGHPLRESAGNMQILTELMAALEETKLLVAIGEQEAKLKALQQPEIVVPAFPATGREMPALTASVSAPRIRVVSIQGIDGAVSATLATPGGTTVVRVGDSFESGRITAISSQGVRIRDGRGTRLVPVEE